MKTDPLKPLNRFGLKTSPMALPALLPPTSLETVRLALGLSQPAMAKTLGISLRQWCGYELGEKPLDIRTRAALCYLLATRTLEHQMAMKDLLEESLSNPFKAP